MAPKDKSEKPVEPEKATEAFDHSGGAALAVDEREHFVEKMFHVGLSMDAPMHYFTVPTIPGYKAVNITKKMSSLDPHPNAEEGVFLMSRTRNIVGRMEALCAEELEAFLKFVRTHSFRIAGFRQTDNKGRTVEAPKCNGVVSTVPAKDEGVTRSRRDQEGTLWPMAKYVYICHRKDRSLYEGTPPTVAELDAAGKKIEF